MEGGQNPSVSTLDFNIAHQQSYSRGQLLLRTFFGWLYIAIPHFFLLYIFAIAAGFVGFIAWWAILFTGKYPQELFNFRVKLMRYQTRVQARMLNLADGYPAFGLSAEDPSIRLNVEYPASMSRGKLLLRSFFGIFYIGIPHLFCLYFRFIGCYFMLIWGWFAILFTGKFPESAHRFIVGTLRWAARVGMALGNMTDKYPPFHGRPEWD